MELLTQISGYIWGVPLIVLLALVGIWFTIQLRGLQFLKLGHSLYLAFVKRKEEGHKPGDISHFQALMTALSATVGTGNIAGVATAIAIGGPGALFWMWVTGLLGMATKFAEAVLAVKYRVVDKNSEMAGGPMYYIQNGLGWKWLAVAFAVFASLAAFGIGNAVQSNSVAAALEASFGVSPYVSGGVLMVASGLVILGGIKSIARATSVIVPIMIIFYMVGALTVLVIKSDMILVALKSVFEGAFSPAGKVGGFAGASIMLTLRIGVARGIFSNESGLGSSPIAAAAAQTNEPVRQALVSMTQTFIDTIVVCTITGLVLLVSDQWYSGETGAKLTAGAFQSVISGGDVIVTISLSFFAFSTILGWCYYGEKAIEYLLGESAIIFYRWAFILFVGVGAVSNLKTVWTISDIFNGLMAFPNLIALIALSPVVVKESIKYFQKKISAE